MKLKFLTDAQALIHGDLHTGSIMVTDSDTRAIDPEFAFFGPMGFDIGALIGNLLIAAIARLFTRPMRRRANNSQPGCAIKSTSFGANSTADFVSFGAKAGVGTHFRRPYSRGRTARRLWRQRRRVYGGAVC